MGFPRVSDISHKKIRTETTHSRVARVSQTKWRSVGLGYRRPGAIGVREIFLGG